MSKPRGDTLADFKACLSQRTGNGHVNSRGAPRGSKGLKVKTAEVRFKLNLRKNAKTSRSVRRELVTLTISGLALPPCILKQTLAEWSFVGMMQKRCLYQERLATTPPKPFFTQRFYDCSSLSSHQSSPSPLASHTVSFKEHVLSSDVLHCHCTAAFLLFPSCSSLTSSLLNNFIWVFL